MIYTDFVIRISLSMLLGFLIGLERQLTGHPAGIRINVLICMGTSFFTLEGIVGQALAIPQVVSAGWEVL